MGIGPGPGSELPQGNLVAGAAVEVWYWLIFPACLSPANIAAGLPGLSISHPGPFPLAQAPTPQIYRLNQCIPPVRLEGEREQKGHFTAKHHFYKMATAWEMLAPGSEL